MVIDSAKTTLAHYRMRMFTSQTGRDMEKAEVFNAFFVCIFNTDDGQSGSQCPELENYDCENDQLPVDSRIVWDLLVQLDSYKPKPQHHTCCYG